MQTTSKAYENSLTQLRMGLLGAATAMIVCFAAAFFFAGTSTQAAEVDVPAAEN